MSSSIRILLRTALAAAALGVRSADSSHALTWTRETIGSTLAPDPSLALDAAGNPWVAYNWGTQPGVAQRVAGIWSVEGLATPAGVKGESAVNLINFVMPSFQFDGDGEPCVLYIKAPESDLWLARHSPAGWGYERLSGDATVTTPALRFDPAGRAHVVFIDAALGPRYGVLGLGGWSFENAPGAGPLALDGSTRGQVAYSTDADTGRVMWSRRDAAGWITETIETVGGTGVSIAVDGSGEPHVAFADYPNQRIRYARRSGGSWTVETVANGVGQWVTTAIAVSAGGEPVVAFYDAVAGDFCFARRVADVWQHEIVEHPATREGCSLALDAQGRPHLSYFVGPTTLRYATTGTVVTGVEPMAPRLGFALQRVAPNPLRAGDALDLTLQLDAPRVVTLELFDPAGRRMASREPAALGAGLQHFRWSPRVASAGLGFLVVRSDRGERLATRVVLLR